METEHDWLKQAIAQGFMLLSSLNLKGRPAAADLKAVAQVWYGLLSKRQWQLPRDAARVKAAFETIAATRTEWPNPADFVSLLPAPEIKMVKRLEKKHVQTAYGRQQAEALRQKLAELKNAPCMNRNWIHGQPHRSVEECKRIYAMKQRKKETEND